MSRYEALCALMREYPPVEAVTWEDRARVLRLAEYLEAEATLKPPESEKQKARPLAAVVAARKVAHMGEVQP